jgi:hypothetical protein
MWTFTFLLHDHIQLVHKVQLICVKTKFIVRPVAPDTYICHRGLDYDMADLADDFPQNIFFKTPPNK